MLRTVTVYSPESPGLTVCAPGETKRSMLAAADTGVEIIGSRETIIKLTRKNAVLLERDGLPPWLTMSRGERLSIKRLSFDVCL